MVNLLVKKISNWVTMWQLKLKVQDQEALDANLSLLLKNYQIIANSKVKY